MFSEIKGFPQLKNLVKNAAVLLVFFSLVTQPLIAQEQSNFTQFYLNPYLLNSSYAGMDGQPSVSLLYRRQWMTIDGGPSITNVSLHAPLKTRLSAGVNINNDSRGFFNSSTLLFTVAYHIPLYDHGFMRFGLSAGGSWNTVDLSKLEAVNDPALSNILDNNASLAGNAGVSFYHKTFNIGIALPTLFSPAYVTEDAFNVKEVKPFQALLIHASNRFYFNNNKNIFEPYLIYHLNTGLPEQLELAGIFHLNHMVWAGASYKQDFGISALGGIKLQNALAIGASYSIKQSGLDELNSPSFEVSLSYLFGKRKRDAAVYSFVNAEKVKERSQGAASRQKQIEAEQKRRAEVARVKEEQQKAAAEQQKEKERIAAEAAQQKEKERIAAEAQQKDKEGILAKEHEQATIARSEEQKKQTQAELEAQAKMKEEADVKQSVAADKLRQAEADKQKRILAEQEAATIAEQKRLEEEANIRNIEARAQQEREAKEKAEALAMKEKNSQEEQQKMVQEETRQEPDVPVDTLTKSEVLEGGAKGKQADVAEPSRASETPYKGIKHEIVKRGNHPQELSVSEYVVVGQFKSIDNAKHFAGGLRSLGLNTQVGHVTQKNQWYVYVFKTSDTQQARAEHERVSKVFLLRDAWVLTVEP